MLVRRLRRQAHPAYRGTDGANTQRTRDGDGDMVITDTPPGVMLALGGLGGEQGGLTEMLLMMGVIFAIFYFLVIRPQRQQQAEHEEMIENLEPGDQVVSVGGLHGRIIAVDDETLKLRVATDLTVTLSRDKVARVKEEND